MRGKKFWKRRSLESLSEDQWEALCDGCGKCCLHKLQDAETGAVFYTAVACRLLDIAACRCRDYACRLEKAPDCFKLSADKLDALEWLPATCAYRLVAEGKDLPDWHHLVCGDRRAIHAAGMSVRAWAISREGLLPEDLKKFIVAPDLI